MNAKKFIGIGIIAVVAIVIAVLRFTKSEVVKQSSAPSPASLNPVTLNIVIGSEKSAFLANPNVIKLLQDEFKIALKTSKRGSIEMVTTDDVSAQHCLWPSNNIAVELARKSGKPVLSEANIFNSPVVFYAWDKVTDAMVAKKLVELRGKAYYVVKSQELIAMASEGKKWKDEFGLNIYGPIKIFSTDPRKSNSGNMWAGLLANLLNNGEVVTPQTVTIVMPKVQKYFGAMGYMESSSSDIFDHMLSQGMGSRPIIVGYENQLVEYILAHPDHAELIRKKIRVMYPEPTIFASHPLISLKPECKRLADALLDKRVQDLAWKEHGFRTGLVGVTNDVSILSVTGIPESIDQVIPLPNADVMTSIINAIGQ